jgi:hypothetical protein
MNELIIDEVEKCIGDKNPNSKQNSFDLGQKNSVD